MKSAHPQAREAHLELARRYDKVANLAAERVPQTTAQLRSSDNQLSVAPISSANLSGRADS
jgi:hypothetical protein